MGCGPVEQGRPGILHLVKAENGGGKFWTGRNKLVDKLVSHMVSYFKCLRGGRPTELRRDVRVVEGTGLENRRGASLRGFESHSLRHFFEVHMNLRKYPSGRRGSPAKGVGWIKPARGFKSLLPRQRKPWNRNDSRVSSFCCPYCPPAPEANCINRSVESARAPKSPLPVTGRGLKNIWICLAFQGSQVYNGSMAKKGEVL